MNKQEALREIGNSTVFTNVKQMIGKAVQEGNKEKETSLFKFLGEYVGEEFDRKSTKTTLIARIKVRLGRNK
jgi:hypothetical protein